MTPAEVQTALTETKCGLAKVSRRCYECRGIIPEARISTMPTVRNCEECSARWRTEQSKLGRLVRALASRSIHRRVH